MAYKVIVETEDGRELELQKAFRIREDAEAEADDIMTGDRAYIDGSQICGVWVVKT